MRLKLAGLMAMALTGIGATLPPSGRSEIPMRVHGGKQFTIAATIGGREREFLFDTGEGTTMIGPDVAADLGCRPWGNITAFRMLGERLDTQRCDDVAFTIATKPYRAFSTIVYDLDEIAQDGGKLAGAIGLDLFDGKTVTLRFAARQIVVQDARGRDAVIRRSREVPLRLARFSEGGIDVNIGVRTPRGLAWMEVDSANAGPTIFVAPSIAPLLGLRADTKEAQAVRAEIAPGVVFDGKARVFPGMIIDGNIGMQFLKDWDLTLDLKNKRAWVTPAVGAR